MTETYIRIKATLHILTRDAAQVTVTGKGSFADPVWIPRSLIHGGDDLKLARAMRGGTVEFRVMDWKARELGLAGTSRPGPEMDLT